VQQLVTAHQLASMYGVGIDAIYKRVKKGSLVPIKRGSLRPDGPNLYAIDALEGCPPTPKKRRKQTPPPPVQVGVAEACPVRACATCAYRNDSCKCVEWGAPVDRELDCCNRWIRDAWRAIRRRSA